ncbi:MAG: apolipoprotein D and lipocalin family protein [Oceanicaulis sp. HLUCCA04]|nr:MAG: apolipoprotein D and lipocalin family protein [Oceanicaulis sp. HLUCCA04]
MPRSVFPALLALLGAIMLAGCQPPAGRSDDAAPLQTVEFVEIERYLGRWFEIARYDHGFERGCAGVIADYALRDDGLIDVTNTCYQDGLDGEIETAEGRARVADEATNAQLEVSFFGPFWGDYWIIDLADDYSWAIVSEPQGRYLWILSRTPQMDEDTLANRLDWLEGQGFDTSMLIRVEQWDSAQDVRG